MRALAASICQNERAAPLPRRPALNTAGRRNFRPAPSSLRVTQILEFRALHLLIEAARSPESGGRMVIHQEKRSAFHTLSSARAE